jgi:hypothetical protein
MQDDKGRLVLTVLLGRKRAYAEPSDPQPPQGVCPCCREYKAEREQMERRKVARLNGVSLVDEATRQRRAKVRGGILLD